MKFRECRVMGSRTGRKLTQGSLFMTRIIEYIQSHVSACELCWFRAVYNNPMSFTSECQSLIGLFTDQPIT